MLMIHETKLIPITSGNQLFYDFDNDINNEQKSNDSDDDDDEGLFDLIRTRLSIQRNINSDSDNTMDEWANISSKRSRHESDSDYERATIEWINTPKKRFKPNEDNSDSNDSI